MWRTTRYAVVLRAYPPHEPTVVITRIVGLLDRLSARHMEWRVAGQSCRGRAIPRSEEEWLALARELRDPEFGSLGLFLCSKQGLMISLTVDEPVPVRNFDVMTLGFDLEHLMGPNALLGFDDLETLFLDSIQLLRCFSAEVGDGEIVRIDAAGRLYLSVDVTKVPDIVHWMNYFDTEMVERLGGLNKLLAAPAYSVKALDDPPGVLLVLQREPFDYHRDEDRARFREITRYLELERLQALYPRRKRR